MHFLSCFLYLGVSWAYSGRKSDDGFNDRFFADLQLVHADIFALIKTETEQVTRVEMIIIKVLC